MIINIMIGKSPSKFRTRNNLKITFKKIVSAVSSCNYYEIAEN